MAEKKNKFEAEVEDFETPQQKLENRVAVLEALVAKHLRMHYGGISPK